MEGSTADPDATGGGNGDGQQGAGGDGGGAAAETAAPKSNQRPYRVYEKLTLPLNVKPSDLLKILQDKFGNEGTIDVLVHVGNVIADAPKKAVEALGETKDLDGDYDTAADSSFNFFPKVKTSTKRTTSFG